MGVILQASYRKSANPTISVPAPTDGKGDPWWYDRLAMQMASYRGLFTNIQLPPCHKTIGGASPSSDGYGVYWEYDLGSKEQPTRFGYLDILRRMCAIAFANGILPMADWVPHQRYGGNNGVYEYQASGGSAKGRFPKQPGCFRGSTQADYAEGRVPEDPVPDRPDDFAFGDELCPVNGRPAGYVQNELIKAGQWLYRTLDLRGCRNDDTKGQAIRAVNALSSAAPMRSNPCIGEYADGSKDALAWWLSQVRSNNYAYDFEVKYRLRDMCNNGSRWDMSQLPGVGLASKGPLWAMRAVPFVENADSDTNGFGAVVYNKLLAYAYVLTAEGWPSVYYRDYAEEADCYGLKPGIDNLLWIHERLANGGTAWRHAEYQFVVYEREGFPGLLVGLNNDIWGGWKTVRVQTSFGPNTRLHDYSGHSGDAWTDGGGAVTIGIPPNDNGRGYVCYSRDGAGGSIETPSHTTTQMFAGSGDLLTPPAAPEGAPAGRIWCAEGSHIHINKPGSEPVRFAVTDSSGAAIIDRGWDGTVKRRGWHDIAAYAILSTPWEAYFTYKATTDLHRSECDS
ncbi:MAG TPA: alpha-amylase domain-containing protein [Bryobacteraceae bacterium]|nr:alpha-amylase domain-containing protein [Bryobacteraceae bacterium]